MNWKLNHFLLPLLHLLASFPFPGSGNPREYQAQPGAGHTSELREWKDEGLRLIDTAFNDRRKFQNQAPKFWQDTKSQLRAAFENMAEWVTDETWPALKGIRPSARWDAGPIQDMNPHVIERILEGYPNPEQFQKQAIELIKSGERRKAELRKILAGIARAKDISQLVHDAENPEFQRKMEENVKAFAPVLFEEGEEIISRLFQPGARNSKITQDMLGTEEGRNIGIHYRGKFYWTVLNSGVDPTRRFSKGFFTEYDFMPYVSHPRTIKEDGSSEFELVLAFEDVAGAYVSLDKTLIGTENWVAHRLVFIFHRDGKTGDIRYHSTKWDSISGPNVHIESAFEGTHLPKKLNLFRKIIAPAMMAFETAKTGSWGLSPGQSLFEGLKPIDEEASVADICTQDGEARTTSGRRLYWNFLAASWAAQEELATGVAGVLYFRYHLSKMIKQRKSLVLGLFTAEFGSAAVATAATAVWAAPVVALATKGTATLNAAHLGGQAGLTLADVMLSMVPAYKDFSDHAAVAFGWIYGFPTRVRSKTPLGHPKFERAWNKLAGSVMNDQQPHKKVAPGVFKFATQVSMFFIFKWADGVFNGSLF